jgi:hypothetical protein
LTVVRRGAGLAGMTLLDFSRRLSLLVCAVFLITASSGPTGEADLPSTAPATALHIGFPDQAERVLQPSEGAFFATVGGFELCPPHDQGSKSTLCAPAVVLPR